MTVTGEYLLSDMVEVIDLLEYMMGRSLTGDLDMYYARTLCRKEILKNHPDLGEVDYSGVESIDKFVGDPRGAKTFVDAWVDGMFPGRKKIMVSQLNISVPKVTNERIEEIARGAKKYYGSENRD